MSESEEAAHRATLQLSEIELSGLLRQKRLGFRVLAGGVIVAVATAIVAAVLGKPGLLVLLVPVVLAVLVLFYMSTVRASRDLHRGTKEHYEGPWQERLVIRGKSGDIIHVELAIHGAGHIVTVTRASQVNLFRSAGITQTWADGRGTVEFSSETRQVISVSIPLHPPPAPPTAAEARARQKPLADVLAEARDAAKARHAQEQAAAKEDGQSLT